MSETTKEQRAEWLRLDREATSGPWTIERFAEDHAQIPEVLSSPNADYMSDADAAFIAAARLGWPATLRDLEAAETEIARLKKELAESVSFGTERTWQLDDETVKLIKAGECITALRAKLGAAEAEIARLQQQWTDANAELDDACEAIGKALEPVRNEHEQSLSNLRAKLEAAERERDKAVETDRRTAELLAAEHASSVRAQARALGAERERDEAAYDVSIANGLLRDDVDALRAKLAETEREVRELRTRWEKYTESGVEHPRQAPAQIWVQWAPRLRGALVYVHQPVIIDGTVGVYVLRTERDALRERLADAERERDEAAYDVSIANGLLRDDVDALRERLRRAVEALRTFYGRGTPASMGGENDTVEHQISRSAQEALTAIVAEHDRDQAGKGGGR